MAGWDDDNFEPQALGATNLSNKWEGEDEDDDVKDNWEDEEEEKEKKIEESVAVEVKQKSKKKLQDIIAEKERAKREELEQQLKEKEEEDISQEEQLRRQKESDLNLALETTFGGGNKNFGIDGTQLTNKDEIQELAENLTKNVQQLAKNEDYPIFVESLVRGVCATLNSFDLKKIKTTIDNLYLEKQRIEKGDKSKKNKGKGKAKLKLEGDNLNQYSAYVDDYDYDDFM
ncbi:hypothetical protein FQR65_LT05858 [Abscondita terminalis]|nr:hypothetical protein FQR65_LT05858 [Abscondita terminalis]